MDSEAAEANRGELTGQPQVRFRSDDDDSEGCLKVMALYLLALYNCLQAPQSLYLPPLVLAVAVVVCVHWWSGVCQIRGASLVA